MARQHQILPSMDNSAFYSVRKALPSRAERTEFGRALRVWLPHEELGQWDLNARRDDPIELIKASHEGRLEELIAIRVARMISSPYGFLRGTAVVMASDVAHLPATGVQPIICGDSHLGNFGFYGSPEGELVMDLNDFDEAHPGGWEWDLRRLVAAIWVAGRENGHSEDDCYAAALACALAYRDELSGLAQMPLLGRSFNRLDLDRLEASATDADLRTRIHAAAKTARKRTSDRAAPRFTTTESDGRRMVTDPPLLTRPDDRTADAIAQGVDDYLPSLSPHWARVVAGHTLRDVAQKVVGVGSVGLRAWVVLLEGSNPADVLFLQLKQARRSVLARHIHGDNAWHDHQGQRVVEYQQALQTVSDPLLGWTTIDGLQYYVRQFRNMKGTVPLDAMTAEALSDYAGLVGHLLAKGHARTSGASMVSGYLGNGAAASEAFAAYATAYADQTEADHAAFAAAAKAGRLPLDETVVGTAFRP